jgi:hypothetical protein
MSLWWGGVCAIGQPCLWEGCVCGRHLCRSRSLGTAPSPVSPPPSSHWCDSEDHREDQFIVWMLRWLSMFMKAREW